MKCPDVAVKVNYFFELAKAPEPVPRERIVRVAEGAPLPEGTDLVEVLFAEEVPTCGCAGSATGGNYVNVYTCLVADVT